jgi:DNA polymerase I
MTESFQTVVVCDFEYECAPGDLPNVVCMVAYVLDNHLRHVRTIRLWRGEFGATPPFDIGPDALFVAYSAWAEMICFLVLGWRFPVHIYDLHTAYLAISNKLLPYQPDEVCLKPRKALPDACRAYGITGWEHLDKKSLQTAIGAGTWRGTYSPSEIVDYCEQDVAKSAELLRAMIRSKAIDGDRVVFWSEYSAKAIARIQARGMPIDVELWNLVQENRAAVVAELLRQFDPSYGSNYPIYAPDGKWSYERFQRWLAATGVAAWPRLESGQLDIESDAFRIMYHVPGIESLHALRDSLGFIVKARLPIGKDGRNRPSLFPFGTATGRNAHAKSPYNAHAGMRSFMRFPTQSVGFYLDWRTQEVGVAAALSGDQTLIEDYRTGDVYHALARLCGLTTESDPVRWKRECRPQRDRMKPLQLGINYGMGVPSLARGLDRHPLIASEIIERHKRRYPRFWQWRAEMVQSAMLQRVITSIGGWPLYLTTSPNQRTLYNFPMQSGGAEMLRLATVRLCEAGIVPIMLIHDGILFEETDRAKLDEAIAIMRDAGRDVCQGLEIGVDVDQLLVGGARYRDKRPMAQKMWATIMTALRNIGALPQENVA